MKKLFLFITFFIVISTYAQNTPVAVNDTVQVMNQKLIEIHPLLNDYDPDGDTIFISYVGSTSHGDRWYTDSLVYFKSDWFEGWEDLRYRVAELTNPSSESEVAKIWIEVIENPDVPFANEDSIHIPYLEPSVLEITANDFDPNGDSFKIVDIRSEDHCEVVINNDSLTVTITPEYTPNTYVSFYYTIREESTNELYYSNDVRVRIYQDYNPELPVAVNDTFECTGGITATFDVLANDFDPLQDTIEFVEVINGEHGIVEVVNNMVDYTAETSYAGADYFTYSFRYENKPWLYTQEARVDVTVMKNPDCPVGVADEGSGMAFTPIAVEVLSNDYDPLGDEIEVFDVKTKWPPSAAEISFTSDSIIYKPPAAIQGRDTAYYKVRKTNAPEYYSEWIPVEFIVSHNPAYPLAVADSAITLAGKEIEINFIENDIIPDSMVISHITITSFRKGEITDKNDSTINYIPFSRSSGIDSLKYELMNFGDPAVWLATGKIYIDIINNYSYDSLYINNINAGINASGFQFSQIDEILEYGSYPSHPHFEVPKGSGKQCIFLNTLWIGGIDEQQKLHLAGERYRQQGFDFQPGPVMDSVSTYYDEFYDHWYRTWKIRKDEIEYHRQNWWKEDYEPIEPILNWPGNGNTTLGMAVQLAPYHDEDVNGIYDPAFGDYPLIRGDECIYFITNDNKPHTESQGNALKVEIHGMAYAYDVPGDSILNNTVFMHYDLINRSENTYYDTYFAVFTDFDLGYAWDDFVGSHVMGNSYYVYNGSEYDGSGEPGEYGNKPPALAVSFLAGPYLDADGLDNPEGGCDESINGVNFSNNIIDDERHGLSYFIHFGGAGVMEDPQIDIEYYQSMKAHWRDDTPLLFGGYGHSSALAVGPECRYMWPGDTDPLNWGTDCVMPNDGYNQDGRWWTEEEVNSYPSDRRGLGSCGPFTFYPGQVQEVDIAYIYANSFEGADSSKNLLKERLMELRQRVLDGEIIISNEELGVRRLKPVNHSLQIFPNPARQLLHIRNLDEPSEYQVYNAVGRMVMMGNIRSGNTVINIAGLEPGFYIIRLIKESGISTGKFIKD